VGAIRSRGHLNAAVLHVMMDKDGPTRKVIMIARGAEMKIARFKVIQAVVLAAAATIIIHDEDIKTFYSLKTIYKLYMLLEIIFF
jgi:hypothetical protein